MELGAIFSPANAYPSLNWSYFTSAIGIKMPINFTYKSMDPSKKKIFHKTEFLQDFLHFIHFILFVSLTRFSFFFLIFFLFSC